MAKKYKKHEEQGSSNTIEEAIRAIAKKEAERLFKKGIRKI